MEAHELAATDHQAWPSIWSLCGLGNIHHDLHGFPVAIIIWRLPIIVAAIAYILVDASDDMFLSSALTKVPEGAWFALALALNLSSILILWRFGKEIQ